MPDGTRPTTELTSSATQEWAELDAQRGFAPWFPIWVRPLAIWFLRHPVLIVLAAVPLLIVAGIGKSLGLPYLFQNDSWWQQMLVGLASGSLLVELAYIGYLLSRNERNVTPFAPTFYILATVAPLVLAFDGLAFVGDPSIRAVVLASFATFAALGWSVLWASSDPPRAGIARASETKGIRGRMERVANKYAPHKQDQIQARFFGVMVLLWIGLSAVFWVVPTVRLPAAVAVCLILAMVGASYGFVRHLERHRRNLWYVLGLGIFATLQILAFQFTHQLPKMDYDRPAPIEASVKNEALLHNDAVLEAWGRYMAATGEPKPKLVIVATSGGGIRAAMWTTHVLTVLEQRLPGFADHVRIITGASGGMVGASHFVATLAQQIYDNTERNLDAVVDDVAKDSLNPVAAHMALLIPGDRGQALEQAWQENTGGLLAKPFAWLRTCEAEGRCPSLVYTPIVVEDGRRVLISNLELESLTNAAGYRLAQRNDHRHHSHEPYVPSFSARQFFELFPDAEDVPISTMARMSASFPYVSPEPRLPTDPIVRVADAGYYDNYGVNIAARWIDAHDAWIRENTSGVLVIQIRDSVAFCDELDIEEADLFSQAFAPLFGPVETVLAARDTTAVFRNDEQIEAIRKEFGDESPHFFTTAVFEFAGEASLTWRLTDEEKRAIRCGLDIDGKIAKLDPRQAGTDHHHAAADSMLCRELLDEGLESRRQGNLNTLVWVERWWRGEAT